MPSKHWREAEETGNPWRPVIQEDLSNYHEQMRPSQLMEPKGAAQFEVSSQPVQKTSSFVK
jgi:hypothetical protein